MSENRWQGVCQQRRGQGKASPRAALAVRDQRPAEGWSYSPLLARRVRLVRRLNELSRWVYDLESQA